MSNIKLRKKSVESLKDISWLASIIDIEYVLFKIATEYSSIN
jgi:hypothetical protein